MQVICFEEMHYLADQGLLGGSGISFCLMALLTGLSTFPAIWIFAVVDTDKMVQKQNDKIWVVSVNFDLISQDDRFTKFTRLRD